MSAAQEVVDVGEWNTFSSASQVTLATWPAPPNSSGYIEVRATCRRVSDGAGKTIHLRAFFKRDEANAAVYDMQQIGQYGQTSDKNSLSAVAATIDAIGADIVVRVEGLSVPLDWSARMAGEVVRHDA